MKKAIKTPVAANIIQRENPILRDTALAVPVSEIKSNKIKKIISDMKVALNSQDDGVAIAAPQIGIKLQIFVVSKKIYQLINNNPEEIKNRKELVFINPKILKISKTKKLMEEGCLSVRYAYGKVYRADRATVEAYDENGEKFVRGGGGILAQIFQHEIDHLNGVLFIDKSESLEEISEDQYNKAYKN